MRAVAGEQSGLAAGVDGCRRGWVAVVAEPLQEGRLALRDVFVVPDFTALLESTAGCAAVAVDIPIGLSVDGRRTADFEARRRIGPRRSSVFPAPARFLLQTSDYEPANVVSKARLGRGLQRQTFNILAKIREVDAVLNPEMQSRIVESHPEVSFWAVGGEHHLLHAKRTPEGHQERVRLLESVYGASIFELRPPRGAAWDDLYDACVLAWTAAHVADGTAVHLPAEVERDARGLRMEIVY